MFHNNNFEKIPTLYIIGGPNGAGKSTLAKALVKKRSLGKFINADIIAQGLDLSSQSGAEIQAGKLMLVAIKDAIAQGESFGFETTLSGRLWVNYIIKAKEHGYHVSILFITVKDTDICLKRIKERVKTGGHSVAAETVKRRFYRCSKLFTHLYKELADSWFVFDNSQEQAKLLAMKQSDKTQQVIDKSLYLEIFRDE